VTVSAAPEITKPAKRLMIKGGATRRIALSLHHFPTMSTTPLAGKVALVTGSSRSIGAAIVKRLAHEGANVVVNYVSSARTANEVVDSINAERAGAAIAIKADVSTVAGNQCLLGETVEAFGKVDIIVLNAGIMGNKTLADVDEKYYDDHMNINVKGPLFLVQAAAPLLKSGVSPSLHTPRRSFKDLTGARVIFFSTSLTKFSLITPNSLVYVATKGAIEQLSRILAKELGARGITVNTISPGPTDTALFREGKPESLIKQIASLAPLNRLGQPDDIASVVSFLASPGASWVNGQNLLANGVSATVFY
jgi:3-oxoacyl-[acyl-carrier protein] reductase